MVHRHRSIRGQSLVESVVAIAVVMMLLMGLVVGTTTTISSTTNSAMRTKALKYAQNALELVRIRRDASWSQFVADFTASPNQCVAGLNIQAAGTCPAADGVFTRTLQFTYGGVANQQMTVVSVVAWTENGHPRSINLQTTMTPWK
jgi:Tfp pilus assembly protein PilV